MSFEALIAKVQQAEATLEARERQAGADLRQLLASWKQLWTPGRVLLGGLGGGFAIGLIEPGKHAATGRNTLQMLSTLAGLVATGSAQFAADKAEQAADSAQDTAAVAGAGQAQAPAPDVPPPAPATRPLRADGTHPDTLRRSGLL
ncbi:MAG TPA: hypothetical protein VM576_00300 [Xanthomonadaceae bacterium]|nr:hypothetical protein [Xanthomonadaceae bacterium]